jgi:hypothetical protein
VLAGRGGSLAESGTRLPVPNHKNDKRVRCVVYCCAWYHSSSTSTFFFKVLLVGYNLMLMQAFSQAKAPQLTSPYPYLASEQRHNRTQLPAWYSQAPPTTVSDFSSSHYDSNAVPSLSDVQLISGHSDVLSDSDFTPELGLELEPAQPPRPWRRSDGPGFGDRLGCGC